MAEDAPFAACRWSPSAFFSWPHQFQFVQNFIDVVKACDFMLIIAFINSAILTVASVTEVPTIWVLQRLGVFRTMPGLILVEIAFGLSFCISSQYSTQYNLLFMNILLVPPLVMFLFFNRQIVAGMDLRRRQRLTRGKGKREEQFSSSPSNPWDLSFGPGGAT